MGQGFRPDQIGMTPYANFPSVAEDEVCFQHPVLRARYIAETTALAQDCQRMIAQEATNEPRE